VSAAFGLCAVAAAVWRGAQIEIFGTALLLGFGGLSFAWRSRKQGGTRER